MSSLEVDGLSHAEQGACSCHVISTHSVWYSSSIQPHRPHHRLTPPNTHKHNATAWHCQRRSEPSTGPWVDHPSWPATGTTTACACARSVLSPPLRLLLLEFQGFAVNLAHFGHMRVGGEAGQLHTARSHNMSTAWRQMRSNVQGDSTARRKTRRPSREFAPIAALRG